ncbi:MAG: eukaryotic-like serine/threonine-protein kinase [Pseudonocardiales bacterium]|nr:eukaryotic-like serine/threonine-protein kinase [Pseudonocardiales bacterium]
MVATEPELSGVLLEERYRVGELLAVGGMSRVYRGTDLRLEREVAIKVMDSRLAADPSFRGRFEREARAIARIDHPCVVDVYDQGEHGGPPDPVVFLVMELILGGTLRDLLSERGALPAPEALAVLEPVLGALAAAHAQGLTHRDVKPENVLIGRSGAVKVADFGLVTAAAQGNGTSTGMIMGTVAYLSPEQVTGGAVDARSDVYSAGILLYELLTGLPPYDGEHPLAVAYQHVNQNVPPPSRLVPGLPPDLDALVASATRRDPQARPPNAETMLHAVRGVRAALGIPRVPVPIPGHPGSGSNRASGVGSIPPAARTGLGYPGQPSAAVLPPAPSRPAALPLNPPPPPRHAAPPRPTRAMTAASPTPHDSAGYDSARYDAARYDSAPAASRSVAGTDPSTWPTEVDPPDHVARRRRSRRIQAIWIGAVLLLAVLIAALAWGAGAGQWSSTPALIGLDRASAERLVTQAGLVPEVREQPNDGHPAGTVADAVPAQATRVRKGSTVTLTVSTGHPRVPAVPPGTAVPDAERILRDAGLTPREDSASYAAHPTAPPGSVVGTSPAAGTEVTVGGPVGLVLSSGPAPARRQRDDNPGDTIGELLRNGLERALRGDH